MGLQRVSTDEMNERQGLSKYERVLRKSISYPSLKRSFEHSRSRQERHCGTGEEGMILKWKCMLNLTPGDGNSHCLVHRLVQDGQITPREGVAGVNVDGRQVRLHCITGLHLLVVQLAAEGRGRLGHK